MLDSFPAVIEYFKETQGWTEQEVRDQILRVYNFEDVSNFSEVDLKSIMLLVFSPVSREKYRI